MKLEDCTYDAIACIRCANCKIVDQNYIRSSRFSKICPINTKYGFDAYSGGGMLTIARAILEGTLEYSPVLLDVLYKCTLCGACDVRCKRNLEIEVFQTLEALRSWAVQKGYAPLKPHQLIAEKIALTGNRYGSPNNKRLHWLSEEIKSDQRTEILYFVGCNSSFVQIDIARAVAKILKTSVNSFTLSSEEWCCGQPLLTTGQEELARPVVEHNLKVIESIGVKTVIASCAECYQTLKVKYPKFLGKKTEEMSFKVLHITEFIRELIKEGQLRLYGVEDTRVTYHDPCHLGRLSEPWKPWRGTFGKFRIPNPPRELRRGTFGIYDPPREILKSIPGIKIIEMERAKEQAWCCGAGGGVKDAFKDFALWTARERLEEANQTGAEAIISCCPWCEENMREAIKTENNVLTNKIQVYDIVQLVATAIY